MLYKRLQISVVSCKYWRTSGFTSPEKFEFCMSNKFAGIVSGNCVPMDSSCKSMDLYWVVLSRVESCRVVSSRVKLCQVMSSPVESFQVLLSPVESCRVVSSHVKSCWVLSSPVESCQVKLCRVVSSRVEPCRVVSSRVVSSRVEPCRVLSSGAQIPIRNLNFVCLTITFAKEYS
jgi:hypothetical protein